MENYCRYCRATSEAEIEELIAEKDQQIKELLEEGKALSNKMCAGVMKGTFRRDFH